MDHYKFADQTATVLMGDKLVELAHFTTYDCYMYVVVGNKHVSSGRDGANYLFGISFVNEKLELLFDKRHRSYSDQQIWARCECRPADESSSRVLRGVFEDKAYERSGFVRKVPLIWPW